MFKILILTGLLFILISIFVNFANYNLFKSTKDPYNLKFLMAALGFFGILFLILGLILKYQSTHL